MEIVKSLIRLMDALLIEKHEQWISGRRYLDMAEYYKFMKKDKANKANKQKGKVA